MSFELDTGGFRGDQQPLGTGASPTFVGLTLSGMTSGSVLFAGASGVVSQDNANLFWDRTNHRLGLGTTTPQASLSVVNTGTGAANGPTSGTWAQAVVQGQNSAGYNGISVQNSWASTNSTIFEAAAAWNGTAWGYFPVFSVDGLGDVSWKSGRPGVPPALGLRRATEPGRPAAPPARGLRRATEPGRQAGPPALGLRRAGRPGRPAVPPALGLRRESWRPG